MLMVNVSAFTRFTAGLGLVIGLQAGSAAPAANGHMGAQSRAAIQMSVRVMPRFSVNGSNAPVIVGRISNAEALDFSSNMTGLRFDIIAISGAPESANTPVAEPNIVGHGTAFQNSHEPHLLLVVPD
jgi:hypothetical protein